jgi:hypothetical protein
MTAERWWRVEFDEKGSVLSCEPVEERGEDGRLIAYVQGATKLDARMNCGAWYRRYRQQQAESQRRLRARRRAEGRCGEGLPGCLKDPEPGYVTCRSCRTRKREANKRYEERQAVNIRLRRRPTPEEARAVYLQGHCRTLHARSVLKLFDSLGPIRFRRWLVEFIKTGNEEAHQRIAKDPLLNKRASRSRSDEPRAQH